MCVCVRVCEFSSFISTNLPEITPKPQITFVGVCVFLTKARTCPCVTAQKRLTVQWFKSYSHSVPCLEDSFSISLYLMQQFRCRLFISSGKKNVTESMQNFRVTLLHSDLPSLVPALISFLIFKTSHIIWSDLFSFLATPVTKLTAWAWLLEGLFTKRKKKQHLNKLSVCNEIQW